MIYNPTQMLEDEHRIIAKVVGAATVLADRLEAGQPVDLDTLQGVVEFMRTFADKCHHGKEEELLFPANAQFTLFVSLDVGRYLLPDSVTVELDGKPVQSHLYTGREVEALKRGAIQRALTTIIKPGTHRLTAVVAGIDGHGRPVRRAATTDFVKDEGQRYLHLRIVDDTIAQQADLQFRDE